MRRIFSIAVITGSLLLAACRHSPQLENAPVISFKNDVQPILSGNCMQSGCHGNGSGGEETRFPLATYDDVIGRVSPGDANGSDIYLAVTGKRGHRIMPPSPQAPLTDNEIVTIYLWIEEGAQ